VATYLQSKRVCSCSTDIVSENMKEKRKIQYSAVSGGE
jgi:hypothetical protein